MASLTVDEQKTKISVFVREQPASNPTNNTNY